MSTLNSAIIVLNLSGKLSAELEEYFQMRQIEVIESDEAAGVAWTHVLTRDVENFDILNETYDLTLNNRFIISLSKVADINNFFINNGSFIIDQEWLTRSIGQFILDKYFHAYGGLSLEYNYPAFKELGAFNVANPFNTGEYLDRMVHRAFENGVDALILKTFFDHLIMYLVARRKKGGVGLPFEVTYGVFETSFALQVNFYVEDFSLFDMTANLGGFVDNMEDHLFHITLQSTDFFDLSYLPEVKKVVITGLWSQEFKNEVGNKGVLFSSVYGSEATLIHSSPNDPLITIVSDSEIPDITDKVSFSNSHEEEDYLIVVKDKQGEPLPDEETLIKGDTKIEEFIQIVSDKLEEDKSVVRISGSKLDVDKFAYRIAAKVDETTKDTNLKVRPLGSKLPEKIKTGLYDFAQNINRPIEELNDSELLEFQLTRVPNIIRKGLLQEDVMIVSGSKNSETENKRTIAGINLIEQKLIATQKENRDLKMQIKLLTSDKLKQNEEVVGRGGNSASQDTVVKDLERVNYNLLKQIEVYKSKLSNLSAHGNINLEEKNFKEEVRKLQFQSQQIQYQLTSTKKELEKLRYKRRYDTERIALLSQEKANLEELLKKVQEQGSKGTENSKPNIFENEIKKLLTRNQILENQAREASGKIAHLEGRLAESLRVQKSTVNGDDKVKVKVNQLTLAIKKLTQDLVDNRKILADTKRETNKLRQEKTALANQLDKLIKESEKGKAAPPKKNSTNAA